MTASLPGPDTTEAMDSLRRALIALRREQFQAALEDFEAALAADPNFADVYAYRSGAMLALGRPLEAQADVARALELDPSSFAVNHKAGELSLRLGDLQSAADSFLAAVRAARPASADEQAATSALALVRVRQRSSIAHHARLPGFAPFTRLSRLSRLARTPRWLAGRVRRVARGTATG